MIMNDPVLVRFQASDYFINIRTVTHQRKSPHSFDLPRERFAELEADGHVLVKDGHSFADLRLADAGSRVRIDFTWLSRYGDGTVKGFTQAVTLDHDCLARFIRDSQGGNAPARWSVLSVDRTRQQPRLDFSSPGARRTIREILAVPVLRHKLTRAVRDNFQWPNDGDRTVRFYADCDRYSFFFQELANDKEGICGGLVLHRHDGLEKSYYGIHT